MRKMDGGMAYVGVDDREIDLFEGQFVVEEGMMYNSYVVAGSEGVAVMDAVDARFREEWLDQVEEALAGRKPDYLVVQHVEPDHSGSVEGFLKAWPEAKVVGTAAALKMLGAYYGAAAMAGRGVPVKDGDALELGGGKRLRFFTAPMVHWPEVMVSFEEESGTLFSADAFGKFGASDAGGGWDCEARRYYFGIVGKYGVQVQALLKKAEGLAIRRICPLHGPVLEGEAMAHALAQYGTWSRYAEETEGVLVAFTSVYGHTRAAAERLAGMLRERGCPRVEVRDLARTDMAETVEDAFRYGKAVLATTTYNGAIFPKMREFLEELRERGWQGRLVGLVENGSWAPQAAKGMRAALEGCKDLRFTEATVTLRPGADAAAVAAMGAMADELCAQWAGRAAGPAVDGQALQTIGYGLYALTTRDGDKDNAMIGNAAMQVTANPPRVAVAVNKANYSHHLAKKTGKMNLCSLGEGTPFEFVRGLGFRGGRGVEKLAGMSLARSANGLAVPREYVTGWMSLEVEAYADLGSHGLFTCRVTEAGMADAAERGEGSMSYAYYHANVKPKPTIGTVGNGTHGTNGTNGTGTGGTEGGAGGAKTGKKKVVWVCKVCGYVYEGEELPPDFVCPWCKHGAEDFERREVEA